ncbi:MAG: 1-(5-phosphoribosyl)-5-[(5-phosphoribosylamino)methylideneamino] imidazole-4-carboxamide isomerase [Xanthomonadales bacterium]|nr:1-(5-phosphoribosyl)-5-[(5-phosphoribosylamino)methylideneamino] imidazole-4-carboxamide isomerase [Xanthomonadales bacterium]
MQIIPAIDLLDGQCVRLRYGDFNQCTVYPDSPLKLAIDYANAGAEWLHIVDLEASRDGDAADSTALFKLMKSLTQKVQTGGGVRDSEDIQKRLDGGANRVIVGTVCATQPQRFIRWLEKFGSESLVAGLDISFDDNGTPWPRSHGWTEGSEQNLWELLDLYSENGLKHLLCTDIGRDGAMQGPNTALYSQIANRYPGLVVQASGGVSALRDLSDLKQTGAAYAITGKALLEGAFSLNEALDVLA